MDENNNGIYEIAYADKNEDGVIEIVGIDNLSRGKIKYLKEACGPFFNNLKFIKINFNFFLITIIGYFTIYS